MKSKIEIGKIVIGLAEYYEKQLTPSQIDMYVEDLSAISPKELLQAVKLYRTDSRNDRFPLPSKLLAMIQPPDDQRARVAAGLIISAVSRIGNYRAADAEEYIGELGWEIVKLQGGWEEVCRSLTDENKGMLQAQYRELGVTLINKSRLGIMDVKPALEFKRKGLTAIGSVLTKGIPEIPKEEPFIGPKVNITDLVSRQKEVQQTPPKPQMTDADRKRQIEWLTETSGEKPFSEWLVTKNHHNK